MGNSTKNYSGYLSAGSDKGSGDDVYTPAFGVF